jgi:hypothetical protein
VHSIAFLMKQRGGHFRLPIRTYGIFGNSRIPMTNPQSSTKNTETLITTCGKMVVYMLVAIPMAIAIPYLIFCPWILVYGPLLAVKNASVVIHHPEPFLLVFLMLTLPVVTLWSVVQLASGIFCNKRPKSDWSFSGALLKLWLIASLLITITLVAIF